MEVKLRNALTLYGEYAGMDCRFRVLQVTNFPDFVHVVLPFKILETRVNHQLVAGHWESNHFIFCTV